MSYASLLRDGVSEPELREYLVSGDTVSVTVRIPYNLRESVKDAATMRGMSVSAFIRNCLLEELTEVSQ